MTESEGEAVRMDDDWTDQLGNWMWRNLGKPTILVVGFIMIAALWAALIGVAYMLLFA